MQIAFFEKLKNTLLPLYYKFKPVFVLPKEKLEHGHYYQGYSTFFTIAKWNAEQEYFIGFKEYGIQKLAHVHDRTRNENVFVPIKEVKRLDVFQREEAFETFLNQNKQF